MTDEMDEQRALARGPTLEERADRVSLLGLDTASVDLFTVTGDRRMPDIRGISTAFQIVLPFQGAFIWHVGGDHVVAHANQILFVKGGEGFRVTQPLPGGFQELIITPNPTVLADLMDTNERRLADHELFRSRNRRASPRLLELRTRFLSWAIAVPAGDELGQEETVLALLRAALAGEEPRIEPRETTRRLIERTKLLLEAEQARPIRLTDVGRLVGASPTYLTHIFRRVEGISLHRYLTQLRLARALVELPERDDLTVLALDLGFSSHSHFSAAFRRTFGVTPSGFRQAMRCQSAALGPCGPPSVKCSTAGDSRWT
jgi:AraC-like DNA-binding protein